MVEKTSDESISGPGDDYSSPTTTRTTTTKDVAAAGAMTVDDHRSKTYVPAHDPFFAFVPKLAMWAGGIMAGEVSIAKNAVIGFPTWSVGFLGETYTYYRNNPRTLFGEIISGFTVAIMQVPESIAFPFVAGVPPLSGLQATFWLATITGIFGGKPGMISGTCIC